MKLDVVIELKKVIMFDGEDWIGLVALAVLAAHALVRVRVRICGMIHC
jgi:hypothetical protein